MHPTHNRQSTGSSPVGPTNFINSKGIDMEILAGLAILGVCFTVLIVYIALVN